MNLRDRVLTLPPKPDETVEVNCRSDLHLITIFRFSDLKTIKNRGNDDRDGFIGEAEVQADLANNKC